jgi:hypothetical protein
MPNGVSNMIVKAASVVEYHRSSSSVMDEIKPDGGRSRKRESLKKDNLNNNSLQLSKNEFNFDNLKNMPS